MSQKLSDELKKALFDAFDQIDEEKEGTLGIDGIRKVLQQLGQNPSRVEMKKYFRNGRDFVDRDGICEFVESRISFKSRGTIDDEIAGAFAKFDTSASSLISVEDFRAILTKIGDEPLTEAEADLVVTSLDAKEDLNFSGDEPLTETEADQVVASLHAKEGLNFLRSFEAVNRIKTSRKMTVKHRLLLATQQDDSRF